MHLERLGQQDRHQHHRVCPEHPRQALFGGEFLEIEFVDRLGLLAIGTPKQEAGRGDTKMTSFGHLAQRVPGVRHQRVTILFRSIEESRRDRAEERGIQMGGDTPDPSQKLGMGRSFFERVHADQGRVTTPTVFLVQGLFGQQPHKPALGQVIGAGEVSRDLFRRDVVENHIQCIVRLDIPRDHVERAPLRLERLELGVVQNKAHSGRQGFIHSRLQCSLIGCGNRANMRAYNARQQIVDGRRRGKLRLGITDQLLEVAQLQVRRNGITARAAFRRFHRAAVGLPPSGQLLGGVCRRRAAGKLAFQRVQRIKQLNLFIQLVWMQIVEFLQLDLDPCPVFANGQGQRGGEAFDNILDRIHIKHHTFARGQRIAGFQHPPRGPAREITHQCNSEPATIQLGGIRTVGIERAIGELGLVRHGRTNRRGVIRVHSDFLFSAKIGE